MCIRDSHTIEHYVKGINRFEGISMIVLNSIKGNEVFKRYEAQFNVMQMDLEELIKNNECFVGATQEPIDRKQFLNDLIMQDFHSLVKNYMNPRKEWKKILYYKLPSFIRKILRYIVIGE